MAAPNFPPRPWGYAKVSVRDDEGLRKGLPRGRPAIWGTAEISGTRDDPKVNVITSEPIPDSTGQRYDLVILSELLPRVALGLTGSGAGIDGAIVNGVRHERQLAIGTHARASGAQIVHDLLMRDPRRLFVIGDVVAMVFLWVFAVAATRRGLAGSKPRFFVWSAAQPSLLLTAGIAVIAIVLLQVLSASNRAYG